MIETGTDMSEIKSENVAPTHSEATAQEGDSQADPMELKIQELEVQVKEKENKYLYLYADFENFKKRIAKERQDLIKFGWEPVARDLLPLADNLERAISHMPENTDKPLADGLKMILSQFKAAIKKQGVEPIKSVEQVFDPTLHEAIAQEESDLPSGTITQEHVAGYMIHGRLLRPARVTISKGKS
ncbi:MAG: nucleotide exchange factor GrpE [Bdellovibrionota bacterium]